MRANWNLSIVLNKTLHSVRATGCMIEEWRFNSPAGANSYFVSTAVRQSVTHPAYNSRGNRASFLRDKSAQVKAEQSPIFSAAVKNEFSYTIPVLPSCAVSANTVTRQCLHHANVEGVEEKFPAFQAELSGRIIVSAYLRRSSRGAATIMPPPGNETGGQSLTNSGSTIWRHSDKIF
jgi:hypothetical protein